ncbi:MAG: AzlD domain-containing protein [Hyphomicrobiaceae bacterium]
MNAIDDGLGGYLAILVVAVVAHESWRWLGLALGRGIDADGALFRWVRAVSTALVAGLCLRLVLFPSGALAGITLGSRLIALAVGIAAFLLLSRTLLVGIGAGAAALLAVEGALGLFTR